MIHIIGFNDTVRALFALLNLQAKLYDERLMIYDNDDIETDVLRSRNYTHIRKNLYQMTKNMISATLNAEPNDLVIATANDVLITVCYEKCARLICVNPYYGLDSQIQDMMPEIYDAPNIIMEFAMIGLEMLKEIESCQIVTTGNGLFGTKKTTYDMTGSPILVEALEDIRYEINELSDLVPNVTAVKIPFNGVSTAGVIFYPDKLWIGINFPNDPQYIDAVNLYLQLTDDVNILTPVISKVFIK